MKASFYVVTILFVCTLLSCSHDDASSRLVMWYDEPAAEWMEALPIGNGRLGMMVHGGAVEEIISLNEITFWTGCRDEYQDPVGGASHLAQMRSSFFAGDYDKVHDLAGRHWIGSNAKFGTHVPVGDMKLRFTHSQQIGNYRRSLDLNRAVADVVYEVNDTLYRREVFCSYPLDVMVMKITSNKPAAVGFDISLDFIKKAQIDIIEGKKVVFSGSTEDISGEKRGVDYSGMVLVEPVGGICGFVEDTLQVRHADEVVLYYDLNTDFKYEDCAAATSKNIDVAAQQSYDEALQNHIDDHAALFSRVQIDLGDARNAAIPTDERREMVAAGERDNDLMALFMQYGRYLLIAGSRPASPLPLNLQAIWNDNLACNMAWTCDYHLDINTQQNYWNANVCNLAECNMPLFDYTASLVEPGRKTVRAMYGTRGWTAHTTANAWGHTPCSGAYWWGAFPTGGTWLALQMVEHYRFTRDTLFMLNYAYPILKENAQFLLDFLTPDPATGYLLTGPSISPENSFTYNGGGYCLTMMPTVDLTLTRELFTALVDVCRVHQVDCAFADTLQAALDKLPPYKIGSKGQLQEWYIDYEERQPNHRHTSHLLGLYPYAHMNTPQLEEACRVSIENRLNAEGWEDTEWSRANTICYYARLHDGENAHESLKQLLSSLSRENLFTISPAGIAGAGQDIFCPDANMAGSAAIAEMLVQSHKGYIEFLPALPQEWSVGSCAGLCVRGGAEVALAWKQSMLQSATVEATADNVFCIKLPSDLSFDAYINGHKTTMEMDSDGVLRVALTKGDKLLLNINEMNRYAE
ncbi:MAG: glycoside hydrolase family 95 protein [Bacteroidaceae bacterium]|nr:glycoside hydrolase family 95 protein [Bacteroidaceae bacterium]